MPRNRVMPGNPSGQLLLRGRHRRGDGTPEAMGCCHCRSCRSGRRPGHAFTLWKLRNVRITQGRRPSRHFAKHPTSDRKFCDPAGGHVLTDHPTLSGSPMSMPQRSRARSPSCRCCMSTIAGAVLPIHDGLPKLKDFPAELGGSGETPSPNRQPAPGRACFPGRRRLETGSGAGRRLIGIYPRGRGAAGVLDEPATRARAGDRGRRRMRETPGPPVSTSVRADSPRDRALRGPIPPREAIPGFTGDVCGRSATARQSGGSWVIGSPSSGATGPGRPRNVEHPRRAGISRRRDRRACQPQNLGTGFRSATGP